MALALTAWHFVKIVPRGTSYVAKNNSLRTGAAYLPAETTYSQTFGFCFRGIAGNDGVGGEGESRWVWSLRDGERQCDMFPLFQIGGPHVFLPPPLPWERRSKEKATSLSTKRVRWLKRKSMGSVGRPRKDLF